MLERKSFKEKSVNKTIKEAEEYFKKVHMDESQFKIFLDFVKIFEDYIPLSDIAVKGIGWRAVREWQQKHKRDLIGLLDETPDERIRAIEDILLHHVKPDLFEKLVDKDDEPLVDKALDDMLEFYKKEYANR